MLQLIESMRWQAHLRLNSRTLHSLWKFSGLALFTSEELVHEVLALLTREDDKITTLSFRNEDDPNNTGLFAEIANDTWPGDCGSRKAYMRYPEFQVIFSDHQCLVLGEGHKWPLYYYVGEAYRSDLMVLPVPVPVKGSVSEAARKAIEHHWSIRFQNSLLTSLTNGGLEVGPRAEWLTQGLVGAGYTLEQFGVKRDKKVLWKQELVHVLTDLIRNHDFSSEREAASN